MPAKQKILVSLLLIFSLSVISFGQRSEPDESPKVVLPDYVMEQVVRRILVGYFKPKSGIKVIYLADQGLKASWLPQIRNIKFQLLSGVEIEKGNKKVYFFTSPERSENGSYTIGFGFGNPNCEYSGEVFEFRISEQKIIFNEMTGNMGGGCAEGSYFGV